MADIYLIINSCDIILSKLKVLKSLNPTLLDI